MEPTQPNNQPLNPHEPAAEPAAPQPATNASQEPTVVSPIVQPAAATSAPVSPAAAPATPNADVPHIVTGGADQSQTATPLAHAAPGLPNGKKKWVLPASIAAVVVLLSAGYVFGLYLPNRPSAVYSKGLKNSGKAVDALVNYSSDVSKKDYKSYDFTGTMTAKTGVGSYDASLTGSVDMNANADVKIKADVMGANIAAEIRSLKPANQTSPDMYVQVSGIKQALSAYGMSGLTNLDGQWIAIDHTLLDTYTKSLQQNTSGATTGSLPTTAQATDALVKAQEVNKQYLFTTDSNKAVLKQEKYVGKETKDGRSAYHYTVGYDKAHLQAYVDALGQALDASSLNTWSKQANQGKNVSQAMSFNELKKSVASAKADYTFDLWVDASTKLVHAVQFADPSSPGSSFTLAQNYMGGDEYPFSLTTVTKSTTSKSSASDKSSLEFTLNKKTDKVTGKINADESGLTLSLNFNVTPSNNSLKVAAPSGAQPVMNVLSQLGLSSGL